MFDQRRAAFDPVTVIDVEHAVDLAHFGMMNVPADHAIEPTPTGLVRERHLDQYG